MKSHLAHKACRKYLSDPTEDVRVATETLLAEFLREIKDVTLVRKRHEEQIKTKKSSDVTEQRRSETPLDLPSERALFISENDGVDHDIDSASRDEFRSETDYRDSGGTTTIKAYTYFADAPSAWIPGQGVKVDYPAIIEIIIQQLDHQRACFYVP